SSIKESSKSAGGYGPVRRDGTCLRLPALLARLGRRPPGGLGREPGSDGFGGDIAQPRGEREGVRGRLEGLARPRQRDRHARAALDGEGVLARLVPRVRGEVEGGPVDRQEHAVRATLEIEVGP